MRVSSIIYLVEEGNVEGEAKRIFQTHLLSKLDTQFFCSGCRVCQQSLGTPIHERDGQHEGLLGLCGLLEY